MKRNPNFVLRNIFNKAILMPIKINELGEEPILLNETAKIIWEQVDNSSNKNELLNFVCNSYNLDCNSEERKAVYDFIEELIELGLIYE